VSGRFAAPGPTLSAVSTWYTSESPLAFDGLGRLPDRFNLQAMERISGTPKKKIDMYSGLN
jgi:hypothetical protein